MVATVNDKILYNALLNRRDQVMPEMKEPPYTVQDIDSMISVIEAMPVICATDVCYTVNDPGNPGVGSGCGACCGAP